MRQPESSIKLSIKNIHNKRIWVNALNSLLHSDTLGFWCPGVLLDSLMLASCKMLLAVAALKPMPPYTLTINLLDINSNLKDLLNSTSSHRPRKIRYKNLKKVVTNKTLNKQSSCCCKKLPSNKCPSSFIATIDKNINLHVLTSSWYSSSGMIYICIISWRFMLNYVRLSLIYQSNDFHKGL